MNIAIVSSLFAPFQVGGSEEQPAALAKALQELGHTVNVISTCRSSDLNGSDYRVDSWQGLKVWRIAPKNSYWLYDNLKNPASISNVQRAAWHLLDLWNPSVVKALGRVLSELQPDVINTHSINGISSAVWKVASQHTRAVVHTTHDFQLVCPRSMRSSDNRICSNLCGPCELYSRYRRSFAKYISAVVAPSQMAADQFVAAGWKIPIHLIRNAVDIQTVPARECVPSEPLRVLFLTRLDPEKGCTTLLSVMDHFRDCHDIEFHIAGRGAFESQFSESAGRLSNCRFHGFVSGAAKNTLFGNTDVFLQISECRENAPLSLLEANQHGLYVVGTEIGGIPELIDKERSGCLVKPGSREDLCDVLDRLVRQRAELRRKRTERMHMWPRYGTAEMAEKYLSLYATASSSDAGVEHFPLFEAERDADWHACGEPTR